MEQTFERVIFTCGGTAGHINPAIALAQRMARHAPGLRVLFVGSDRGLEGQLVPKAGYPLKTVHISSFHRSLRPREVRHNLVSLYNLLRSPAEARRILKDFSPQVVIGTGGYASYPLVRAAARAGIPTAIHESNAVPGLTTKLLAPYARQIFVGWEACRPYYPDPEKVVVTGTPVRQDFFSMTRQAARLRLGLGDGRPVIVSFWGSLGAAGMNRQIAAMLALEAAHQPFHHLHAAGSETECQAIAHALKGRGIDLARCPALHVAPYIHEMAPALRAADLVLCRAGASTVSELTALGLPAILVPSPYVTNHHQEKNAQALAQGGGALVLSEPEATGQRLFQAACQILHDDARRREMARAMAALGVQDAAERMLRAVAALLSPR